MVRLQTAPVSIVCRASACLPGCPPRLLRRCRSSAGSRRKGRRQSLHISNRRRLRHLGPCSAILRHRVLSVGHGSIGGRASVWTNPYFDAEGAEIWMVTRSVPVRGAEGIFALVTTDLPAKAPPVDTCTSTLCIQRTCCIVPPVRLETDVDDLDVADAPCDVSAGAQPTTLDKIKKLYARVQSCVMRADCRIWTVPILRLPFVRDGTVQYLAEAGMPKVQVSQLGTNLSSSGQQAVPSFPNVAVAGRGEGPPICSGGFLYPVATRSGRLKPKTPLMYPPWPRVWLHIINAFEEIDDGCPTS